MICFATFPYSSFATCQQRLLANAVTTNSAFQNIANVIRNITASLPAGQAESNVRWRQLTGSSRMPAGSRGGPFAAPTAGVHKPFALVELQLR